MTDAAQPPVADRHDPGTGTRPRVRTSPAGAGRQWTLCCCLLLLALPLRGAEGQRSYRIGIAPSIPWSPAHVAHALGFWRELGLTVEVADHVGAPEHRLALGHRLVDLAVDRVGCLLALHQAGVAMTLLGECGWARDQERFVGRAAPGPMRGATIGIADDDPAVLGFLDLALRKRGATLAQMTLTVLPPQDLAGAYIRRRLDWLVVREPFAGDVLIRGAHLLATTADLPGSVPLAIGGRVDVLATIPREDLVRILRGWIRASDWAGDPANAEPLRALMVERALVDDGDEAALRGVAEANHHHDRAALGERNRPQGELEQHLERLAALLAENGRTAPLDRATLIDTSALREALAHESVQPPAMRR